MGDEGRLGSGSFESSAGTQSDELLVFRKHEASPPAKNGLTVEANPTFGSNAD